MRKTSCDMASTSLYDGFLFLLHVWETDRSINQKEQTGIHGHIGIPQAAGDAQSSFFVVFQVLIQHKAAGGRIKDIAFFCAILARNGFGQAEILPRHVVGSDAVAENNAFFS